MAEHDHDPIGTQADDGPVTPARDEAEDWAFDAEDPRNLGIRYESAEADALTAEAAPDPATSRGQADLRGAADSDTGGPALCPAVTADPDIRAHAGAQAGEDLNCTQVAGHDDQGQHLSTSGVAWVQAPTPEQPHPARDQATDSERGEESGHARCADAVAAAHVAVAGAHHHRLATRADHQERLAQYPTDRHRDHGERTAAQQSCLEGDAR
jgi:hypothetical protein